MLYYGYEHRDAACAEQWRYDQAFLQRLSPALAAFSTGLSSIRLSIGWG